jgi:hypothetical protein
MPSSLTPELDIGEGLQAVGLGQYVDLFRKLEIGWPLCKLCYENPAVWDELFAADLSGIQADDRTTLVQQMPKILGSRAVAPPLGTTAQDRVSRLEPAVPVPAATVKSAGSQLAAPPSARLPGARADGTIGLWLEKKSPARGKGWQRRWFVINPHKAEMHYFADGTKEELGDVGGGKQGYVHSKGFLELSRCHKITSNNFDSVQHAISFFRVRYSTVVVPSSKCSYLFAGSL